MIPAKAIYLLATVSDFVELSPWSDHTKLKIQVSPFSLYVIFYRSACNSFIVTWRRICLVFGTDSEGIQVRNFIIFVIVIDIILLAIIVNNYVIL